MDESAFVIPCSKKDRLFKVSLKTLNKEKERTFLGVVLSPFLALGNTKGHAMTTKTPFDPDDDDDAEDIVKVLKKTPPPPAPPPPILFVSFFSFFFGVASKTTAREIHIENALYSLPSTCCNEL